jgi:hypothetical protein
MRRRRLVSEGKPLLKKRRWSFDIPSCPHTHDFPAGLNGIFHVLEYVRGIDKIECPLGKG